MKRTTKIIIGMLFATLCFNAVIIHYIISKGEIRKYTTFRMEGAPVTLSLPPCKVMVLEVVDTSSAHANTQAGVNSRKSIQFCRPEYQWGVPLYISSIEGDVPQISFSSDLQQHFSTRQNGDTLHLQLHVPETPKQDTDLSTDNIVIAITQLQLHVPATVERVIPKIPSFSIIYRDFTADKLILDNGGVELHNCHVDSLLLCGANSVEMNSGSARVLYVDCDATRDWRVEADSFHIDTQYLTGSYQHSNPLQHGECRQLIWVPKPDAPEATLNVSFHQPAKVELQ